MIHLTDSGHGPGTIIVAAGVMPRFYEFQMSLDPLAAPVGTHLVIPRSCDIAQNFNTGVKRMKPESEWAWFMGDDHAFDEDILMKLLEHRVDVVVPITSCKAPPWMPCMFHGPENGEICHEDMPLYHWDELSGDGLMPLPKGDFIGQAGMLVRRPVLDKIGYPWFKCGQFDKGRLQEDMYFCHEIQQLGYTVYIDQDIILDHYFVQCITARKHEGKWTPALRSGNGQVMVLPDAKPKALPEHYFNGKSRIKWDALPNGDKQVLT